MTARRLLALCTAAASLALVTPDIAQAQFTPRFSQTQKGPPSQWHVGITVTAANLGDYTSEYWPGLKAPTPVIGVRGAWAIPVKEETLFLVPEIEIGIASTSGEYGPPTQLLGPSVPEGTTYPIADVSQTSFSIALNFVRANEGRRTLLGGGIGYYLIRHDPRFTLDMQNDGSAFLRDPFMHLGLGLQVHVAHRLKQMSEKAALMLEGRYRLASIGGNVSDRTLLVSELQISLYVAVK